MFIYLALKTLLIDWSTYMWLIDLPLKDRCSSVSKLNLPSSAHHKDSAQRVYPTQPIYYPTQPI